MLTLGTLSKRKGYRSDHCLSASVLKDGVEVGSVKGIPIRDCLFGKGANYDLDRLLKVAKGIKNGFADKKVPVVEALLEIESFLSSPAQDEHLVWGACWDGGNVEVSFGRAHPNGTGYAYSTPEAALAALETVKLPSLKKKIYEPDLSDGDEEDEEDVDEEEGGEEDDEED